MSVKLILFPTQKKNRQNFNRMFNCARRPAALPCPSTENGFKLHSEG